MSIKSHLQEARNTVRFTNVPVVLKQIEKRNRVQKMRKRNSVLIMGIISVLLIASLSVSSASAMPTW